MNCEFSTVTEIVNLLQKSRCAKCAQDFIRHLILSGISRVDRDRPES